MESNRSVKPQVLLGSGVDVWDHLSDTAGERGFVFAEERKNKTHCEHPVKKSYLFDTEYLP